MWHLRNYDKFTNLYNPFSIRLAKRAINTTCERVGNSLALGVVRDDCFARSGRSRSHSKSDTVTSGEGDTAEVVGIVWVPFVPCIIGCLTSAIGEVNTCLQDCC